jgi:hypothetical protein
MTTSAKPVVPGKPQTAAAPKVTPRGKIGGPAARQIISTNNAEVRPPARPPAPDTTAPVRVEALTTVYYDDKLRRPGDVFTISGRKNPKGELAEFSHRAMRLVDSHTPESITGSQAFINREHDDIRAGREAARVADASGGASARMVPGEHRPQATVPGRHRDEPVATGSSDPLGADDDKD